MKTKTAMKRFSIVLPATVVDRLDRLAKQRTITRSELIREMIRSYLNNHSAG